MTDLDTNDLCRQLLGSFGTSEARVSAYLDMYSLIHRTVRRLNFRSIL